MTKRPVVGSCGALKNDVQKTKCTGSGGVSSNDDETYQLVLWWDGPRRFGPETVQS